MSNFLKNILQIGYVLNDKWVIIEFIGKRDIGATFNAGNSQSKPPAPKELGENFKEWVIQNDTGKENLYGTGSLENISYPSLVVATSQYPGHHLKTFGIHGKLLQMSAFDVP
jgi:hypothetical protein